jgi:hypothetical protein
MDCIGYGEGYHCSQHALPNEALCTFCKGRRFELDVVQALKDLGGEVIHNIRIDGGQCDIVVTFREGLCPVTSYVECKAEAAPIGIRTVDEFNYAFTAAREARPHTYDKGMLVAQNGFTADAKSRAAALGLMYFDLAQLREKRADFTPYLTAATKEYEDEAFFKSKHYLRLVANSLTQPQSPPVRLDEILEQFASDVISGPLLVVFGDFGAGKTTTLRRFFWLQCKRRLAGEQVRIPIFVSLRDYQWTMDLNKTVAGHCCPN